MDVSIQPKISLHIRLIWTGQSISEKGSSHQYKASSSYTLPFPQWWSNLRKSFLPSGSKIISKAWWPLHLSYFSGWKLHHLTFSPHQHLFFVGFSNQDDFLLFRVITKTFFFQPNQHLIKRVNGNCRTRAYGELSSCWGLRRARKIERLKAGLMRFEYRCCWLYGKLPIACF